MPLYHFITEYTSLHYNAIPLPNTDQFVFIYICDFFQ